METWSGTLDFIQPFTQTEGLTSLHGGILDVDQGLALKGGALIGTNTVAGSVSNTGGTVRAFTSIM